MTVSVEPGPAQYWWSDEGPLGYPDDVLGFTPLRLWVSSANFTTASRASLEFGYWTEEPQLLRAAEDFLLTAIAHSEGVDPDADQLDPEFAPVEFDDAEFAEYAAEMHEAHQDFEAEYGTEGDTR